MPQNPEVIQVQRRFDKLKINTMSDVLKLEYFMEKCLQKINYIKKN